MSKSRKPFYRILGPVCLGLTILLAGCGGDGGGDDFDPPSFPVPPTPKTIPPLIAYYDSYEGIVDTILQVDELFGVLANDEYPIFDTTIEYPLYTVQGGYLEVYQDGGFEYDPPIGFTGQDSFTYTLVTGDGRESSATAYITVYPEGY